MDEVATTAIKAVNGGLIVVLFALVGEAAVPKRFAGLFSAAPSIALANLLVIVLVKGSADAQQQSTGMVLGAGAMVAVCAFGIVLIPRLHAVRASMLMCAGWLALTVVGYMVLLR
jgi:hypothetical protein